MQFDISVIVPIYNLSNYLRDSLNSITMQTIFNKLEVILINDGSTDGSIDICKEFVKKYSNFILVNTDNKRSFFCKKYRN